MFQLKDFPLVFQYKEYQKYSRITKNYISFAGVNFWVLILKIDWLV